MSEIKPLSAFPTSAAVSTSQKTNFLSSFSFIFSKSSLSELAHKPTSLKLSITSILSSASAGIFSTASLEPPQKTTFPLLSILVTLPCTVTLPFLSTSTPEVF
jgi:hypothetical protein